MANALASAQVLHVAVVFLYPFDQATNSYGEAKKAGASILRSNDKTAILFYGSTKEPIALATVTNNFYWPITSEDSASVVDDLQQAWSIRFENAESLMKFTAMVLISMSSSPHPRVPQTITLSSGEGEAVAETGDLLLLDYICWIINEDKPTIRGTLSSSLVSISEPGAGGEAVATTNEIAEPLKVRIGKATKVPKALEEHLIGAKKGSQRLILCPATALPDLGLKKKKTTTKVAFPPENTYLFKLIVTDLKKAGVKKTTKKKATAAATPAASAVPLGVPLPGLAEERSPATTDSHPPAPSHSQQNVPTPQPPTPSEPEPEAAPKLETEEIENLVGLLGKSYKTQFAQSFKKIMGQMFTSLQGSVEQERTYTGVELLTICRDVIKGVTMEVVNQAMSDPSELKPGEIQKMIEKSLGTLKEKEGAVQKQSQDISAREKEIRQTVSVVEARENKLKTLASDLHNQEERIRAKTSQLEAFEAKLKRMEKEVKEKEQQLQTSSSENDFLRSSADSRSSRDEDREDSQTLQPAKWLADDQVSNCCQCNSAFSLFNRKHHCRRCGRIFCADCSSKKMFLPEIKAVARVCDNCAASSI